MNIDIKDHAEFSKYLKMGLDKSIHRALLSTATRMVSHINVEIIPNIKPRPPVDRGTYRAGFRVRSISDKRVLLFNSVPHAPFIDWGVRATSVKISRAMIDALAGWVKRKGVGAKSSSVKTKKLNKPNAKDARSIAWAIAKSMKKKGIFTGSGGGFFGNTGLQILQRAVFKFDHFFREELTREMKKSGLKS